MDEASTISRLGATAALTSARKRESLRFPLALAVFCALVLSLAMQQDRLLAVWRGGGFFDADDAMRMVQIRDLLAGQHWYDMTAWRLDPPSGLFMHWSRIVDIPIVVLLKFFGLFLPAEAAERAARIAFPTLTFAVLLAGGGWAAKIFAGAGARVFGVFSILFCGVMFWQFPPGRIDHHAPQITLLLFAVAALARAFAPTQARWAALSGACVAVSLGIGLENLPFFGVIAAVPGLAFLARGEEARPLLRHFAAGLALTLVAVYVLTIGPSRWFVAACDALSPIWFVSAVAGAAAYGLLSLCGRWRFLGRLLALAGLGGASLAPMALFWTDCLKSPFGVVDPVVKSLWLDHVAENLTLAQNYAIAPGSALLMAVPAVIGFCGAVFGCLWQSGVARARWMMLAVVIAAGFAAGYTCVRVFSSTLPLAALGVLAPVEYVRQRLARKSTILAVSGAATVLACLSSFGVAIALPEFEPPPGAETSLDTAWRSPSLCRDTASYPALDLLPPGLAAAPIPAGSYLLAQTHLSVLAAPYHRNNHGNRAALDILRSDPALAETLARRAGVKYVLLCWSNPAEVASYQAMGPDALAAQISRGSVPGWLRELKVEGTIFHAYEVLPPNG